MKKYLNLFDFKQKVNYMTEVLSGLTVALALVPEAVAFAILAGLSPLTGLYAAFSIGLITSILGGRPGMISGATGAIAIVFIGLIAELKIMIPGIDINQITQYVLATVIMAGIIQMQLQQGSTRSFGKSFLRYLSIKYSFLCIYFDKHN